MASFRRSKESTPHPSERLVSLTIAQSFKLGGSLKEAAILAYSIFFQRALTFGSSFFRFTAV